MRGKQRFDQAMQGLSSRKEDRPTYFSGLLGILTNGEYVVEVTGRPNFVWVRLRNSANEIIQAFNGVVSPVYDLPILVERDPHNPRQYRVVGRDIGRYNDWGNSSYLPRHGGQHSFNPPDNGGDVVWVYSRQVMPLLVHPSGTSGAANVVIEGHSYYWNGVWRYGGETGTASLITYKPTGSNARMVLVYLDTDGNPSLSAGDYLSVGHTGTSQVIPALPAFGSGDGVPLAGVRLVSGTSTIRWENIYDLRPLIVANAGSVGTDLSFVTVEAEGTLSNERVLRGSTGIGIIDGGANDAVYLWVTGSYSTGGGGGSQTQITVYDDGVFVATGTSLHFQDGLVATASGTAIFIDATGTSGGVTLFDYIWLNPDSSAAVSYNRSDTGLESAISAADAGDQIWIPAMMFTGIHIFPANVVINGSGQETEFQNQVTMAWGTELHRIKINRVGTASSLIGINGPSSGTAYVRNCEIRVQNISTGAAYAAYVSEQLEIFDSNLYATSSGTAYAGYAPGGTLYVYGGKAYGSTARFG